jgi:hypothetical protein
MISSLALESSSRVIRARSRHKKNTHIVVQDTHTANEQEKVKVRGEVDQLARLEVTVELSSVLCELSNPVLNSKAVG